MLRMTAKEYQEMLKKNSSQKPAKHRNKYVYVYSDGFVANDKTLTTHGKITAKYDSEKEYRRHKELELLVRAGKISELKHQDPILIMEGFVDSTGKKQQPIFYKADYTYIEDGKRVVEDVKGIDRRTGKARTTEAFRLKWKLLKEKYPNYIFQIY